MTAEGAGFRDSHWAARPWQGVRRLSARTSLRIKLVTALLALVAVALAVMGFVGVAVFGSYLQNQVDAQLRALNAQVVNDLANNPFAFTGRSHQIVFLPNNSVVEILASNGQPLPGSGNWQNLSNSAPAIPTSDTRTSGSASQPFTVSAPSGGYDWRVIVQPAQYTTDGVTYQSGTLVVGLSLGNLDQTMAYLIRLDLIVSVVILLVLMIVGFAVVRANLQPLVDIEETAGEIADGHLNRRVPERDPRTEIGSLGRSLNIMLSQIETAFHAREQSEAAAHQSEERMRRFIADASHELRTPLTAIRGFAEYYRQRGGLVAHWNKEGTATATASGEVGPGALGSGLTPDDLDRIMHRVEKEAARMGLLVEDLLLLARLDQQRPLARQPIDLLSLAADAVHDARLLAPDRTIDLSVQPGAAFLVIGDEPRLRQVIGNLMSNALTHTPDGSPIEVSIGSGTLDPRVRDSAPAVTLDVADQGPGMTPEQAHRVFERFYRADQARTRTTGGSGLGLAIVSALVAAHGGVASVRTAPDRGATFRIALPLAPEAQGGPAADDDPDLDESGEAHETSDVDGTSDASVTYGTAVVGEAGAVEEADVGEADVMGEADVAETADVAEEQPEAQRTGVSHPPGPR
jgi:signal transduction histidine kinase